MTTVKTQSLAPFFSDIASSQATIKSGKIASLLKKFNKDFYAAHSRDYAALNLTFNPEILQAPALAGLSARFGSIWGDTAEKIKANGEVMVGGLADHIVASLDSGHNGKIDLSEVLAWNAAHEKAFFQTTKADTAFASLADGQESITQGTLEKFFAPYADASGRISVDKIRQLANAPGNDVDNALFTVLEKKIKTKDVVEGAKISDLAVRFVMQYSNDGVDDTAYDVDYTEAAPFLKNLAK